MVFVNKSKNCATGISLTLNPATGEKDSCDEYLINIQREDVVTGFAPPTQLQI
jgi:phosphoenolpyruvate synthase/pyruvate phosphate dikinase